MGSTRAVQNMANRQHAPHLHTHTHTRSHTHTHTHTRTRSHICPCRLPEFLDLILVAAFLKLGDGLHTCGLSGQEFFFTAMEFLLIFSTRYMIDEFWWNFYLDDLWNQFLFLLYIMGVFLIALMVSYTQVAAVAVGGAGAGRYLAAASDNGGVCVLDDFHLVGFFSGILITRSVLSVFWYVYAGAVGISIVLAACACPVCHVPPSHPSPLTPPLPHRLVELYFDEEARGNFYMHPTRNFITIAISIAGIVLNNTESHEMWQRDHSVYLMAAIVFNEYYLHFYKCIHTEPLVQLNEVWPLSRLNIRSKDHAHEVLFECDEELEAVQTRMGIFILIVLGEGVIQLLLPSFDTGSVEMREGVCVCVSLCVCVCVCMYMYVCGYVRMCTCTNPSPWPPHAGVLYLTLMGLLLIWSIAKQFFDAAQRVPSGHALRRCMRSGIQWLVMHAVSGMCVHVWVGGCACVRGGDVGKYTI